jgi:uncharacterized protein YndB with AHSA1/START domain
MKGTLKVTTPSDREILVTRVLDAPRRLVFECLSRPEFVRQWLLGPPGWTMPVCEIDFRVGGRFRYVWRREDGNEMGMGGEFREIVPPERIVHVEVFDADWTGGETTVTTLLAEREGRTTMSMTIVYSSTEARDGALRSGMTEGMSVGYDRLDELLAKLSQAGGSR